MELVIGGNVASALLGVKEKTVIQGQDKSSFTTTVGTLKREVSLGLDESEIDGTNLLEITLYSWFDDSYFKAAIDGACAGWRSGAGWCDFGSDTLGHGVRKSDSREGSESSDGVLHLDRFEGRWRIGGFVVGRID